MDNITIAIDPTVLGYWGWWLVAAFAIAFAVWACFLGTNRKTGDYIIRNEDVRYGTFFVLLIAVFVSAFVNFGIYSGVLAETEDDRIEAALIQEGFTQVVDGPNGTYFLQRDGSISQYAGVETQDNVFQFIQISE